MTMLDKIMTNQENLNITPLPGKNKLNLTTVDNSGKLVSNFKHTVCISIVEKNDTIVDKSIEKRKIEVLNLNELQNYEVIPFYKTKNNKDKLTDEHKETIQTFCQTASDFIKRDCAIVQEIILTKKVEACDKTLLTFKYDPKKPSLLSIQIAEQEVRGSLTITKDGQYVSDTELLKRDNFSNMDPKELKKYRITFTPHDRSDNIDPTETYNFCNGELKEAKILIASEQYRTQTLKASGVLF